MESNKFIRYLNGDILELGLKDFANLIKIEHITTQPLIKFGNNQYGDGCFLYLDSSSLSNGKIKEDLINREW